MALRAVRWKYYGLAVALATAAFLVRAGLFSVFGAHGPYFTFFLAAALSSALGGFGPGLVATVLGAVLAGYVFPNSGLHIGWLHLWWPSNPSDPSSLIRYLLAGSVVSWLCGTLHTSRERARQAEARLQESVRIYRAIGESIPFGIWTCDANGRNTYCSESFLELVGLTQEQCSNFGWTEALHPDEADRTAAAWKECVGSGGNWDVEHRFRDKDGRYHPVLARGVPVRDDRGRTICWAGINLDISQRKEAEAGLERQTVELRRSNRELEQFAFAASHDLREPLRIVNIYSELLIQAAREPGRLNDMNLFATHIHQSVDKLERLIRDLLSMSRATHREIERRPVSSDGALDQAVNVLAVLIGESGARIEREPLPFVLADEGQLTQVFQNLVSNAVKYRKAGAEGRVRIGAQSAGEEAVFVVEDNGIGFDPAHAEKIFGLFHRLHGNAYEGTGLGLAICQRIVERHGGRIWAESAPGVGSKFFFTLALAANAAAEEPVHAVN